MRLHHHAVETLAMKCLAITLGLIVLLEGGNAAAAGEPGGFFPCPELVFFGSCQKAAASETAEPRIKEAPEGVAPAPKTASTPMASKPPEVQESMWAEPVRGPDGQLRVYLPPRPVRDFLERPTPENARDYLAWNQARIRRVDDAINVMRDVAAQQFGITGTEAASFGTGPSATNLEIGHARLSSQRPAQSPDLTSLQAQAPPRDQAAPRRISIVYAFAAWCPYSRQQTPIINQLAAHVPVRGVVFDSKPEDVQGLRRDLAFPIAPGDSDLRQRLGVRSYPTILFFEGSRLRHVAHGLQPPDRLASVLGALARRQPLPMSDPEARPAGDTCQLRG